MFHAVFNARAFYNYSFKIVKIVVGKVGVYLLSFGHVCAEAGESGVVGRNPEAFGDLSAHIPAPVVAVEDAENVSIPNAVN